MPDQWYPLSELGQRMMTHQVQEPNPVGPYVDATKRYLQSGDFAPIHELGTQPRDYLRELLRNPDILAKNIDQASNFNFACAFGGPGRWNMDKLGRLRQGQRLAAKTPDQIKADLYQEMAAQGKSYGDIANELGISRGAIAGSISRTKSIRDAAARNANSEGFGVTPEKSDLVTLPDGTMQRLYTGK